MQQRAELIPNGPECTRLYDGPQGEVAAVVAVMLIAELELQQRPLRVVSATQEHLDAWSACAMMRSYLGPSQQALQQLVPRS
jgi:hypothetical protein